MKTRKRLRIIAAFALLGLLMAGLVYARNEASIHGPTKPSSALDSAVDLALIVLCPSQMFFVWCIDCDVEGWDGFVMYSIIGALNALLYALVGTVLTSAWKESSGECGEPRGLGAHPRA